MFIFFLFSVNYWSWITGTDSEFFETLYIKVNYNLRTDMSQCRNVPIKGPKHPRVEMSHILLYNILLFFSIVEIFCECYLMFSFHVVLLSSYFIWYRHSTSAVFENENISPRTWRMFMILKKKAFHLLVWTVWPWPLSFNKYFLKMCGVLF